MLLSLIANIGWWSVFLFYGIKTSMSDLRCGKIYNKDILKILVFALFFIFLNSITVSIDFKTDFFYVLIDSIKSQGLNFLIGLGVGIACWFLGLWPPGDAKLFSAYLLLIPAGFVRYSPYMFPFTFLIDITVISGIIIMVTRMKEFKIDPKLFTFKSLYVSAIAVFSMSWFIQKSFEILKIPGNFFITAIFLFLVILLLKRIFKLSFKWLIIILAIVRLILDYPNYANLDELILLGKLFLLFVLLRIFLVDINFNINTRTEKIQNLKEGDLLAQIPCMQRGNISLPPLKIFALYQYFTNKFFLEESMENPIIKYDPSKGLQQKDLDKLKTVLSNKGIDEILVFRTIFFAPIIFLAAIGCILSRGSIFFMFGWIYAFLRNLFVLI